MFSYLHVFMETLYQLNRGWTGMDDFVQLLRCLKKDLSKGADELKMLYLMIPYCRDVIRGKGERDLAYSMIYAFYQVFPVLAIKALHLLFCVRDGLPMVGSWCDVKYFCVFIERISPLGAADPLIAIMASIANKNIDDSSVAKWIPRECHHPELFSVFVRDFFHISSGRVFSSVKKGLYRKRVAGPKESKGLKGPSGTWFMGKYVREAVRLVKGGTVTGEPVEAIEGRWRRLLKTFPSYIMNGLPIVDLDIGIPDDVLFHSIGFACLIAEKIGLKRIMLAGTTPTWVDVSRCNGFLETVRVVWSYCEVRGVSRLEEAVKLVEEGFKYVFAGSLLVFIFSQRFSFDWRSLILCNRCVPVFWNMGNTFETPVDLYVGPEEEAVNFIYMSGYASGLLMPFFSAETRFRHFYKYGLESYSEWSVYFDLFISNVMPIAAAAEASQEIPDSLSLGQI
jgi:hypothetical protein